MSAETQTELVRHGEYSSKGEYHEVLDPNWVYYPVYIEKMKRVRKFLDPLKSQKILDLGCGEGVLVKEYRAKGYNISGIDFNYSSECVTKASILQTGLPDASQDVVICLDVIEHLSIMEQDVALAEIHRVLKPGGTFYATIPNLAHLASRLSMLVTGKLIRTSSVDRHPGDRPFGEYKKMISAKFTLDDTFGIFPTFPILSVLTYLIPGKVVWLHAIYNALLPINAWCFLNFFVARKK